VIRVVERVTDGIRAEEGLADIIRTIKGVAKEGRELV